MSSSLRHSSGYLTLYKQTPTRADDKFRNSSEWRRSVYAYDLWMIRILRALCSAVFALSLATTAAAQVGGSLSGVVKDPSGGVIPGVSVTATNTTLGTMFTHDDRWTGAVLVPEAARRRYEVTMQIDGFKPQKRTGIQVDADSALQINVTLELGEQSETVTVSVNAVRVDTVSTQLGEVVPAATMTSLSLNGRSYTDLLSIQPGVIPTTTIQSNSVIMAGVTGPVSPSGGLNPGIVSVSGQRETANGFYVNGSDVQERMNGGTGVVPNLDSIEEFRLLTNNFDPEYGNYNGGIVNVVTKSGSDVFHGNALRVLPQHQPRRPQLLLARARGVQPEPARRHDWRSAEARQDLLLRRLSGDADDAGHRDRQHLRCRRWPSGPATSRTSPIS